MPSHGRKGQPQTLSEVGTREHRLPSPPSVAAPAVRSCCREEPVELAGLHSSTTVRPSTKHSGTVLPWLSGTQSSSRESLHTCQAAVSARSHAFCHTVRRSGSASSLANGGLQNRL